MARSFSPKVWRDDAVEASSKEFRETITDNISVAHVDPTSHGWSPLSTWLRPEARRVTGRLGYESRCAQPTAFDVMLGSQLGVGAYRAVVENKLNGVAISITGQLDLQYVPFDELVNPQDW